MYCREAPASAKAGPTPAARLVLQPKLRLGQADDQYEREAERAEGTAQSAGHDFGKVRIHADERAARAAEALNARAFTVGRDIYFGAGEYAPETQAGTRLLAHELTHVRQQTLGPCAGRIQRTMGDGHDLTSARLAGEPVLEACYDDEQLLRVGNRGVAVRKVQETLVATGFPMPRSTLADGGMDGIFGSETDATVREYQARAGLNVDGLVGPQTIGHMDLLPECPAAPGGEAFATGEPRVAALPGALCLNVVPPPPQLQETPVCGPDVTAEVGKMLNEVDAEFSRWGAVPGKQQEACERITHWWQFLIAWDTVQFHERDWLHDSSFCPPCGHPGPCSETVRVGTTCLLAYDANYYLFGRICQLCAKEKDRMMNVIRLYVALRHGDTGAGACACAEAAYDRANLHGHLPAAERPQCAQACPVLHNRAARRRAGSLQWVWEPHHPRI